MNCVQRVTVAPRALNGFGLPRAGHTAKSPRMSHVLTLVANRAATSLTPAIIARAREATDGGAPAVLSPGEAADIPCATEPDMNAVRAALDGAAIDAIATSAARRRKQLLLADMDSTIVQGETLDELGGFAGAGARIAAITARAMNGELDFKAALRERVAMLKGLDLDALERTWRQVRLTPGARELVATMRARGALTALISGGFAFFTGKVAESVGLRPAPFEHSAGRWFGADRRGGGADPGPGQQTRRPQ